MNRVVGRSPEVSVVVCAYNSARYIRDCVNSILAQSFEEFEFVIVDDASTDKTADIVNSFNDPRIKYIRFEVNSGSIGAARNRAIEHIRGQYVFFTDSDCCPKDTWIEEGMKAFSVQGVVAVEGRVVYHKDGYRGALSDRSVSNSTGGLYMCSNMAFRAGMLRKFKFRTDFYRLEDRELTLRVKREGDVPFVPTSVVYHQKIVRDLPQYFREVGFLCFREKLILMREYGDVCDISNPPLRIYSIALLLTAVFPPLVLAEIVLGRVRSWNDWKLLPFVWFKALYFRFTVWKSAIREKHFII